MLVETLFFEDRPLDIRRTVARVRYVGGNTEHFWFDTPAHLKTSVSGNPWLALLLPLAARTGEDLQLAIPVDPYLKQNAMGLLRLWEGWFPGKTKTIRVIAEEKVLEEPAIAVVSAFTGGVDAFFTVNRHPECRHYVNVLGLDMPLRKRQNHERLFGRLEDVSALLGASMIPMATNLRETRWGRMPWESFASGAAISSCFLMLEREFGKVLIPSSFDYRELMPWGSHPLSDPLYSTSTTQIIHEGASHTRVEKLEAILDNPVVLDNLHVCFQGQDATGQDETNCCRCSKCYRTMTVLDLLGKLDSCKLFNSKEYSVEKLSRLDTSSPVARSFFEEIRLCALRRGRQDVVASIDKSFRRSKLVAKFDFLGKMRFVWRVPVMLRARAFGDFPVLTHSPAGSSDSENYGYESAHVKSGIDIS